MDYKAGTELGLEPCGLWRHNVARIGNVHELFHGNGIKGKSHLHLAAVNALLQFAKTAYAADKVNALVAAQVLDAEKLVKNKVR